MSNLTVAVYFTKSSGTPATGLTLTDIALYLTAHNKSTGVDTVILGPGHLEAAHTPEESVSFYKVVKAAQFYLNIAQSLSQRQET